MKKITVSLMRGLEKQVLNGEISYSRMIEILNETLLPERKYIMPDIINTVDLRDICREAIKDSEIYIGTETHLPMLFGALKASLGKYLKIHSEMTSLPESKNVVPSEEIKQKSIEFAEWISNNQFTCYNNEWTSIKIYYSGCVYTIGELYKLFNIQKGGYF